MAIRDSELALSINAESGTRLQFTTVSKLEAAAAGLKQIREKEVIGDDGVESSGRDPREAAVKAKLK